MRRVVWRSDSVPFECLGDVLPFGLGRSYGDVCLNDGGTLLDTTAMSRVMAFDTEHGVLRCEAGMSLDALLALVVPRGWFPAVTPGTRFVTIGGAIANDVHGKNHHRAGSFGRSVTCFELLRSDGERRLCSAVENPELYRATIGGLGLTGLILWAELRLKRIPGPCLEYEQLRFGGFAEYLALARESDASHEYTVAWFDALAIGRRAGRGLFMRANHAAAEWSSELRSRTRGLVVPFDLPASLLNSFTMRAFNALYFQAQGARRGRRMLHYEPFFYPLDAVRAWNRVYGRGGLLQYQCVVPLDAVAAVTELLDRIGRSGSGSFLAVLKTFGNLASPGVLSFPREGVTLALDFPYKGRATLELLEQLDGVVRASGGAVYPAKDARMSSASFQAFFPGHEVLAAARDPQFSSGFWRRVSGAVAS